MRKKGLVSKTDLFAISAADHAASPLLTRSPRGIIPLVTPTSSINRKPCSSLLEIVSELEFFHNINLNPYQLPVNPSKPSIFAPTSSFARPAESSCIYNYLSKHTVGFTDFLTQTIVQCIRTSYLTMESGHCALEPAAKCLAFSFYTLKHRPLPLNTTFNTFFTPFLLLLLPPYL